MIKIKLLRVIFVVLGLAIIEVTINKVSSQKIQSTSLRGTKWVSNGNQLVKGDTLLFKANNQVEYFMGELEFTFNSEYYLNHDTLKILTKTISFEVENVSNFAFDLKQIYLIQSDSLALISSMNKRKGKWIKASQERIKSVRNYSKLLH